MRVYEKLIDTLLYGKLLTSGHLTLWYTICFGLSIISQIYGIHGLDILSTTWFCLVLNGDVFFDSYKQFFVCYVALWLGGISPLGIPLAYCYVSVDKNGECSPFNDIIKWISGRVDEFITNNMVINSPYVGTNSSWSPPEQVKEICLYWYLHIKEMLPTPSIQEGLQISVTGNFMRKHELNNQAIELGDRPPLSSGEVYKAASKALLLQRVTTLIICMIVSVIVLKQPVFVFGIALFMLFNYLETNVSQRVNKKAKGSPIKEGVYKVDYCLFNLPLSYGIGVSVNGVLHVPYHVCGDNPIVIGKCLYKPYYLNIEEDLVTYSGPPQMTKPTIGQEIYINIETENSRTTYRTRVDIDTTNNVVAWHSVTKPGESGSPVFMKTEHGLSFVGQVGRYYLGMAGDTTGYAKLPETAEVIETPIHQVVTYPGSGKTREIIPKLIIDHIAKNKNARILVCGPTRVVCKELYMSLSKHFKVGLNVKDEEALKNAFAPVQIAAHYSAVSMILNAAREVSGLTYLVLDEAHFDDVSTKVLRQYGQHLLDSGLRYTELSATIDGKCDDRSNHHIEDVKLKKADFLYKIEESIKNDKRIMVFVPSISSKEFEEVYQRCKGTTILKLSRAHYQQAAPRINDPEVRVIITTDIAECGLNVYDLDCVFDFGLKYNYVFENGVIHGRRYVYDEASRTQRRGRIGRFKPGYYYYINDVSKEKIITASDIDAEIITTGRAWASYGGNELGIMLSDYQAQKTFANMSIPTFTFLTTNSLGHHLPSETIHHNIKRLRGGEFHYIGCGKGDGCEGKYRWYDERLHDWLLKGERISPTLQI